MFEITYIQYFAVVVGSAALGYMMQKENEYRRKRHDSEN